MNPETIIETRTCPLTKKEFTITDADKTFYEKVSPTFSGKKYLIPFPTLCPDARQQRRLSWRNERKLYKRKCDATGKEIVSVYSSDKKYTVYNAEFWWSDHWDSMKLGKSFDFSQSAMRQMENLIRDVPRPALYIDVSSENSGFCNYGGQCKDSYLSTTCYNIQNALYCQSCWPSSGTTISDLVDSTKCTDSSQVYMSIHLENCYECFHSYRLRECRECLGSEYLMNSSRCIACVGLTGAKNCILNTSVTPEEFDAAWKRYLSEKDFRENIAEKFALLSREGIDTSSVFRSENSEGQWLYDCKSVRESTFVVSTENAKYCLESGYFTANMYDGLNAGDHSDLLYEAQHAHKCFQSAFLQDVDRCKSTYYCQLCYDSTDLFLCCGLRNKQYCILNKQYTKEEYEVLVPKIIEKMIIDGEWGEFFPSSLSPFGYNESVAMEYFPLTREEALGYPPPLGEGGGGGSSTAPRFREDRPPAPSHSGEGRDIFPNGPLFNWSDYEPPFPSVEKVIPGEKLPESIEGVPDDVLNWAIKCETSGKLFKIVKPELEFYRKHSLPLPRKHPDVRHGERVGRRAST